MTTAAPSKNALLESALRYAELGYPVFPCIANDKRPATANGLHDATTDTGTIRQWWAENSRYNIGIRCDGLLVLDLDIKPEHPENHFLDDKPSIDFEVCPQVRTPRGGRHYYFRENGTPLKNSTGKLAENVDTRATGGYVVAPPSIVNGKQYEWVSDLMPRDELPIVPEWAETPKHTATVENVQNFGQTENVKNSLFTDGTNSEPSKPDDRELALQALEHISAIRADNYQDWLEVGMVLHSVDSGLFDAWDKFSSLSSTKYNRAVCEEKWASFAGDEISIGSLLHWAAQDTGWKPDYKKSVCQKSDKAKSESTPISFPAMTCAALMGMTIIIRYYIYRILVEGQPLIIAGPKKALKTTLIIALALALATGKSFLGFFEVFATVNVGIMTGESGLATIKETIQRIAYAMGIEPSTITNLFISEKLPQLDSVAHLEALRRFIVEHGLKVLILDPAYMMMSGADAGNLFVQGQLLRGITELCQELGCTLIICHHTKRNIGRGDPYSPPELEDIAWAGFQEWARQWLLVARREAYQPGTGLHRLWMTSGGSAGHGGLWALNVTEGTTESDGGRYWQVDVISADDARAQVSDDQEAKRAQASQEALEANKKRLLKVLAKYPDGETKTNIRDFSGLHAGPFKAAFSALLMDGCIVSCELQKTNRKKPYEAYKINDSNPL
jgi:hypothetical protein